MGDLVDHVDHLARSATALALGHDVAAEEPEPTHQRPGWRAEVAEHLQAIGPAWLDPSAWSDDEGVPGSGLSATTWGRIALTELVVHGWDVAQATDQPFALDDATLDACWRHVAAFLPDAPFPDLWGPAVTVPDDAPLIDRIVALTGRTP